MGSTNNEPLAFLERLFHRLAALPVVVQWTISKRWTMDSVDWGVYHPSPPHFVIRVLKSSFSISANLPTVAFLFFFRTNSTDSADCLPILLSMSVFYFLVFLFHLFSFWFPAADYADLCQLLSSYLLVSYRTFCLCGAAISQADCPFCRRSVSNVKALNDGKCGIEWDVILYHIYNSWIFAAIL